MGDLRIRIGDGERSFDSGDVVRIGRDPESTILVQNPNVSRSHAEVAYEEGTWRLKDLGSSQGTFHDGRRVDEIEIRGTVHVTLGLEGRGEVVVLESAITSAPSSSRPGGSISGVDLQASTEIVGSRAPSSADPRSAGTVIEPELVDMRPAARIESIENPGTVISGDEIRLECSGRSYRFLPHQQIRIGRDPDCEIVVANPTVSRIHAVIYHDGTGWILTDPGSATGVFRGGGQITSAMVEGSSAVWLGKPEVGERVVMATATAARKAPPNVAPSLNEDASGEAFGKSEKSPSAAGKVVAAVVITALVILVLLIILAVAAYAFLARS